MKKILIICLSLFIFIGCSSDQKKEIKPRITIDTNYFKDDDGYQYYYNSLNRKEKRIYRNIYNCLIDHAKKVSLDPSDYETIQKINQYVLYDHPEIFYFNYFELKNEVDVCTYSPVYSYTKKERQKLNRQLETVRTNFINTIPTNASDYDKAKLIYEFVINQCTYLVGAKDNQEITSSLIYGKTVCSGYVKAFQYLGEALGIKSTFIVGDDKDPTDDTTHAWNMIYLDNDYYYIDATWGDYDSDGITFPLMHYFMFDSTDMLKLYEPSDLYEKTKTGTYCYFKYEKLYSETYNKQTLGTMINQLKNNNTAWMPLKFSDSCFNEAKTKLIDQKEMFDLFNRYTNRQYLIQYFIYDDLNVIIFKQTIK